jgi:molecular chaperone GrpE
MTEEKKSQFQVSDRRFWVENESVTDEAPIPDRKYPSFIEELKARTELAEQKLKEKVKNLEKENEAFRARLINEMEKRLQREKPRLFEGLLEVLDNFERALQATKDPSSPEPTRLKSLKEGVQLNLELFLSKLKAAGIEPLEVLNQPFDPHQAEAVGVLSVEDPALDQHVVEVVQQGFLCGDQLIRPAKVRVGQYAPSKLTAKR